MNHIEFNITVLCKTINIDLPLRKSLVIFFVLSFQVFKCWVYLRFCELLRLERFLGLGIQTLLVWATCSGTPTSCLVVAKPSWPPFVAEVWATTSGQHFRSSFVQQTLKTGGQGRTHSSFASVTQMCWGSMDNPVIGFPCSSLLFTA